MEGTELAHAGDRWYNFVSADSHHKLLDRSQPTKVLGVKLVGQVNRLFDAILHGATLDAV